MEPTRSEKKFLKGLRGEVDTFEKEERQELKKAQQAKTKDLLCMGADNKFANGPNPLSIRKKVIRKKEVKVKHRKRRLRKGVRSKLPKVAQKLV